MIGYLIVPDYGWRIAFLIGALPALYVLVLRRSLPGSPRYLLRQGRVDEARETAASLGVELGDRADDEKRSGKPGDVRPASGLGALWVGGYARRTTMLWVLWFGMVFSYYGIFTWLPQILVTAGYEVASSFGFVLLITLAQIPGYFSAAYLVDKWGRKPTLVSYLLGSAVAALLFGLRGLGADASGAEILLWGSLVSFFNLGAWGVLYGYTPERYPTPARLGGWLGHGGRPHRWHRRPLPRRRHAGRGRAGDHGRLRHVRGRLAPDLPQRPVPRRRDPGTYPRRYLRHPRPHRSRHRVRAVPLATPRSVAIRRI